ncbi:MAG: DUF3772 domain-containing protein [Comamonas sp.]
MLTTTLSFCHNRLLRWLLALHLALLGCVGLAHAADALVTTEPQITPQAQLQAAANALDKVRQSLEDAEASDTLQTLADQALKSKRDADNAVTALEPLLKQLDVRVEQLGPKAEGAEESPELTRQRKELAQEHGDLDSAIKRGKLLSVEAAQAADSIEKLRTQQFNAQIASKALSPLSPALWKQFAEQLPLDLQRIGALTRQGQATFRAAIAEHGWAVPLRGIVLALLLLFPLRMGLRHLGYRYAASDRAPDGRLRRTGLAVWLLLVGTVLPGLASLVFIEHLRAIDAIAPRLQSVADAWIKAAFVAAFFLSISASTLVPKRPSWRLLAIDDIAAPTLTRYAWGAAWLTWFAMMLNAVDIAARTSAVSTVALDGLIALTYVGLILSVLVTITQQRQRLAAPDSKGEHADAGRPVQRSSWLLLAWLGGHLTVLAALVAALLGYLNFSVFVATQMVWITVVVLATSLLMKFADDLCTWFFGPDSRPGRSLAQGMGLRPGRVEQVGVLLSALLRVSLLLLGLAALTAPFGNASSLLGWTASAAQSGLPVGDTVLKPMAIGRALVVLVIGLTIFRALQHWLVETYLPKTELDIGARNSISTVARYVGIILSGLWTLAALGIGFEKVALLASALSVGIGFGLQAITQNFVSGLILLAERPVKLGDRVRIGDQVGDIRRISVRATEIQTDDKSTLIVPNSELITKSVQNLTMDGALGRISIAFAVPLNTDVVRLKELLLGIYRSHEAVLETPAPAMYVDSISGSVINITSFGHVSSPRQVYSTRSDLLFELLRLTAEQGMALSSATDIHLVRDPAEAVPAAPVVPAPASSPDAAPGMRS